MKYVHKKGRVLAGFREREKPYIAELRRCETLIERFATLPEDLAALVEGLSIRDKLPQVEVAAGDGTAALVFRVMEPPTAEDLERLERFGRNQRAAICPNGRLRPLAHVPAHDNSRAWRSIPRRFACSANLVRSRLNPSPVTGG